MALREQPEEVTAVADASFLIGLCSINQFKLIPKMLDMLYIAPAVWEEVVERGVGRPGAQELEQAAFVQRQPVHDKQAVEMLEVRLDTGESASLVLAQEMSCSVLLVD